MDDTNSIPNQSEMPGEVGATPPTVPNVQEQVVGTPVVPTADKPTQEASATLNVAHDSTNSSSSSSSKIIIGLLIIVVLVVMGVLGYFIMTRATTETQIDEKVEVVPTSAAVSPTPQSEQSEVDQLDTSFPESDVKAIQTDLQGL